MSVILYTDYKQTGIVLQHSTCCKTMPAVIFTRQLIRYENKRVMLHTKQLKGYDETRRSHRNRQI